MAYGVAYYSYGVLIDPIRADTEWSSAALAGLFLSSAGLYYGVDRKLTAALGRFGYLASGSFRRTPTKAVGVKPLTAN